MSIADHDRGALAELERLVAQLKSRHTTIADGGPTANPMPAIEALERDIAAFRAFIEEAYAQGT